MKFFTQLYLKECREHKMVLAFLVGGTIALEAYVLLGQGSGLSPRLLLGIIPFASVWVLPFILAYSLSSEWKGNTHFQLLALPVQRFLIPLSKYMFVLSVGIMVYIFAAIGLHLIALKIGPQIFDLLPMSEEPMKLTDMWWLMGLEYFSLLIGLVGLAVAVEGIKFTFTTRHRLVAILTTLGSVVLYFWLRESGIEILGFLGEYRFTLMGGGEYGIPLARYAYGGLTGLIALVAGLWCFETRVEA